MSGDDDALHQLMDAYGPVLATLVLTLTAAHPVQRIARHSFACRQLESFTLCLQRDQSLRLIVKDSSLTWTADELRALPLSSSLRTLCLSFTEMTEAQVLVMLSACPALQSLSLWLHRDLSLAVLPGTGRACRGLLSLSMLHVSASLFQSGLENMSTTPSASPASSEYPPLFPRLLKLTLHATKTWRFTPITRKLGPTPPSYSTSVLDRLVSLLSSSPLRALYLNLAFASLHELRVFAPLTHLEELRLEGPCVVPLPFLRQRTITRHDVERSLVPRLVRFHQHWFDELWIEGPVFQEERTFRGADGQWMNGREAFFAFLSLESDGDGGGGGGGGSSRSRFDRCRLC